MVGDHAYLKLNHAELVDVVDALHRSGKLALEKRLRVVLAAQATPLLRHDHA